MANGILKTVVLGQCVNIKDGKSKQGKTYVRMGLKVRLYTGRKDNPYETQFVNVVAFDKTAEAIIKVVKTGTMVYAEGQVKAGKPTKTNSGEEFVPLDLIVRDWSPAGVVEDTRKAAETSDEDDEFDE